MRFFLLLLCCPLLNFAQPLRQKVDYFHGTKQPKVLYHVLKKQKKVWHGPYQEFYFNDQLKVHGKTSGIPLLNR